MDLLKVLESILQITWNEPGSLQDIVHHEVFQTRVEWPFPSSSGSIDGIDKQASGRS